MEIFETHSPREEAGRALSETLLKHANVPVLLMLSGGSAFTILDFVSKDALGPHVTVTMLDERYSADPKVNNFAQLEQTDFYKACLERCVHSISTKVLGDESMEALRNWFDTALHEWKEQYKNGVVIATIGIGDDGHVAGMFPGDHGVNFNGDDWVVGYSVEKEVSDHPNRVTITNTFLRSVIDMAFIYLDRDKKTEIVSKLIARDVSNDLPMNVLYTLKTLSLFTTPNHKQVLV